METSIQSDFLVQKTLNNVDGAPMYLRVADAICESIAEGHYASGDRLPAHTSLAESLGVSPLTVSKGFELLRDRGIVEGQRGRGTYVKTEALRQLRQWKRQGFGTLNVVLSQSSLADFDRESQFIAVNVLEGLRDALGEADVCWRYAQCLNRETLGDLGKDDAVFVLNSLQFDVVYAQQLMESGVPVVSYDKLPVVPCVSYDRRDATILAFRHLVDCGYRRLGFIGAIETEELSQAVKYHTFMSQMLRHEMDIRAGDVAHAGEAGRAYGVMREMIARGDLPEAIFVDSDYKAMEAICALKDAGLKVPDDIGIVSYDNLVEAARFDPPLTTVRTPRRECGRRAAELMRNWPTDGTIPPSITLDSELVVRGSTRVTAPVADSDV